jgi:hypothetical protein
VRRFRRNGEGMFVAVYASSGMLSHREPEPINGIIISKMRI